MTVDQAGRLCAAPAAAWCSFATPPSDDELVALYLRPPTTRTRASRATRATREAEKNRPTHDRTLPERYRSAAPCERRPGNGLAWGSTSSTRRGRAAAGGCGASFFFRRGSPTPPRLLRPWTSPAPGLHQQACWLSPSKLETRWCCGTSSSTCRIPRRVRSSRRTRGLRPAAWAALSTVRFCKPPTDGCMGADWSCTDAALASVDFSRSTVRPFAREHRVRGGSGSATPGAAVVHGLRAGHACRVRVAGVREVPLVRTVLRGGSAPAPLHAEPVSPSGALTNAASRRLPTAGRCLHRRGSP